MDKIDIPGIREKLALSQSEFAELLGISVRTLQNWEQGRNHPNTAALALLMLASEGKLKRKKK